ncbi:MOSC domain-containing protein [Steroidobacter sp. S1-65]|uniref:MOSC domain-containing protein n=1 Tax=Steroidobacter gossypii TaxID=2805490 RepID=A0ABS1X127_9GAMM|nr:MOSC domain-containing protein [Steroidobacter gossypii]MBM0106912.1 MOSC domain-containing protein [Steroidobacter gossypii]
MATALAVLCGKVRPLGRTRSGIDKKPVSGPQRVEQEGLVEDRQADRRVHGGVDKAVHCYPWSHYTFWRERLPGHALLQEAGAFGENLSIDGMDEQGVCMADRWRIGNVIFEVSQGRQPCFKLNLRFGVKDMAAQVQDTLRAGWYLRVLEPGELGAGDQVELLDRPHPEWTIARILAVIRDREVSPWIIEPLLELPLPPSWRRMFERRLQSAEVEDWSRRLG